MAQDDNIYRAGLNSPGFLGCSGVPLNMHRCNKISKNINQGNATCSTHLRERVFRVADFKFELI